MSYLVCIADNHNRDEPPFLRATVAFYDWFSRQDFNVPENTFVDLGDHWHRSKPTPLEYDIFYDHLLNPMRMKRRIFLRGNHDRTTPADGTSGVETNSIDPLTSHGCEVVLTGKIIRIDGLSLLMLPYQHDFEVDSEDDGRRSATRDEYYARAFGWIDLLPVDKTFCFYHFPDETQPFFGKARGVDLSPLVASGIRLVGGDIHVQDDRYIGPPHPTKASEAGLRGRVLLIDTETGEREYRACPRFLDFVTVRFGDAAPIFDEGETLLVVENAPSTRAAEELYGAEHVWDVKLETFGEAPEDKVGEMIDEEKTIDQHRVDFYAERGIDSKIQTIVEEALKA